MKTLDQKKLENMIFLRETMIAKKLCEDLPIMPGFDAEKDERYAGVELISFGDESKVTAEDCGTYWQIRDWEIHDGAIQSWFCGSSYSIDKDLVKRLSVLLNKASGE